MRLLHVGFNLDGAMGDNFIELTKAFQDRYNNLVFVLTKKSFKKSDISSQQILELNYNKNNFFGLLKDLKLIDQFINKNKIDIILFSTPNLIYNIYISLRFKNIKKVYYLHDPIPHTGEKIFRKFLLNLQNKILVKKSNKVLVASKYLRKIAINRYTKEKGKIEVVELGLLSNMQFPELRDDNSIKENIDLLFFGRLEEYKGLNLLGETIHNITKEGININCTIIGKGDIEALVDKEYIKYFDVINKYIPDKNLALYIKQSKVIVFPYINATGTQAIQIAYYYKKPVIASNVGCFNDYVQNNKTGLLFETGNPNDLAKKIKDLLIAPEKRKLFGEEGSKMLERKFELKNIMEKYERIFSEIK
ncbi:glycosyltransferase family 4 protein [Caldibacillus thermoamylovorans]